MTILPSYIGIIIGHYKDPHLPTSIMHMKCHKGFDHCSHGSKKRLFCLPRKESDHDQVPTSDTPHRRSQAQDEGPSTFKKVGYTPEN